MIEKFSAEELEQIKKELGIEKEDLRKQTILRKEISELNKVWNDKPFVKNNCVFNVIDNCLCNFQTHEWGRLKGKIGTSKMVNVDVDEYCQMFQEILEIIKKHNRKWEGENQ